jgi:hypothetical protein
LLNLKKCSVQLTHIVIRQPTTSSIRTNTTRQFPYDEVLVDKHK